MRREFRSSPPLQGWYGVDGRSQATNPFGPIEAEGRPVRLPGDRCGFASLVGQQNGSRIVVERREEEYPLTTLRKAERARVDDAVGPSIAEALQRTDDDLERTSLRQSQHERNVLEQDLRRPFLLQEAKDFSNQAGSSAFDPSRFPRLAQVLAGESGSHQVDVAWEAL